MTVLLVPIRDSYRALSTLSSPQTLEEIRILMDLLGSGVEVPLADVPRFEYEHYIRTLLAVAADVTATAAELVFALRIRFLFSEADAQAAVQRCTDTILELRTGLRYGLRNK